MRRVVAAVSACVLAGALLGAGLHYKQSLVPAAQELGSGERKRRPVKVLVTDVRTLRSDLLVESVGTARSASAITVYPAAQGDVVTVSFRTGQSVEQGQVLVQLDDRDDRLAVALAEVQVTERESLLRRYQQAVEEGAVPQSEVDQAQASFDAATIELEQARLALSERQIRAPFEGIVGIPLIDPGDRVDRSTQVTTLDDSRLLHIDFQVPERLADSLAKGVAAREPLTLTSAAFPKQRFPAKLVSRATRINAGNRTFQARAELENEDLQLVPGMSFIVQWNIQGEDYPAIPEIALQWSRDGAYCWIVRNQVAERVPVRVVGRRQGLVLVEGSLSEAESVVVQGVQRLGDGEPVEVLNGALG